MKDKYTKDEANYRKADSLSKSCYNCDSMNKDGTCQKVQGIVKPEMLCDHWTPEKGK